MKNLFILFVILLTYGCSSIDEEVNPVTQIPVDVYIAGQKDGHACYWKNNQEQLLNDNGFPDSQATKIIVSNNDVYVLGKSSNGTDIFWKNNSATNLTEAFSTANHIVDNIGDMEINGTDVYFSGQVINNVNSFETFHMAYWKNGQQNVINGSTSSFLVSNMPSNLKVINNNVIIVYGYAYGYSINGEIQNQNSDGSKPKGIAVKNNEVYVYGNNHIQNKAYYKNVFTQDITLLNVTAEGHKLIFDLSDIYISNGSSIYKNNNLIFESTISSYYKDFIALNTNIYILKTEGDLGGQEVLMINEVNAFSIESSIGSFNSITVVQNPI